MADKEINSEDLTKKFWQFGKFGVWLALIVHALFIFMFWTLGVPTMAIFNIFSVLLFTYCVYLLKSERYYLILTLSYIEITLHALFATGVESGFYYYLFILVILAFVVPQKSVSYKLLKVLGLIALFFIIEMVFSVFMRPICPISEENLFLIRIFNLIGLLVIVTPIIYFHIRVAKDTEELLYKHATLDPLTGLYNRRHFISIADYEYAKRENTPLTLILADIDHFKKINDTYGHEVGDIVLKTFSKLLLNELREEDTLSRWGGEEFLFLLPNTTLDKASEVAERIRSDIENYNFIYADSKPLHITCTFGIAECKKSETFDETLSRTDEALYKGKYEGRNQIVY